MFQLKKIAAAGLLGSLAVIGLGAAQAVGADNPGNCTKDEQGHVRCVQVSEYRITEKSGKVRVGNEASQTCSGKGQLTCTNSYDARGGKS
ncbi:MULTISPECIES: hypothetical protein [Streptomyces]|uniref:Uncharacterized protein n=1 Tax=Streptomyces edwardsiae TaxID=3075527 RepID=A0ABU2PUU7_9ACTN|nr:hypothetical protein [Streptomyces sp. DSM 41636]MDT0395936.1 hypothetical protein [Streptomyces sp. DSM 41636]